MLYICVYYPGTIFRGLSYEGGGHLMIRMVKVFDKESNELIRQFPSEEMLALQDKMTDLAGFLFSENV